ncbi:LAMI_0A07382g1_1 [Lachancea mirantina]|uniref:LAMI_0A07382g1_1 n=1 Tax=Lachancea mirantina TaxID=1230905 RepID=A0A1G4IR69_9SACH|nr:LAMI_0A07382g1_1 [Lachancea mirantina]
MLVRCKQHATLASSVPVQVQQLRHISRRRIAYPFYPFERMGRQHPKKHDSNLKHAMRQFLGPRNFKGEYSLNKYFDVATNHEPKYITPDLERGVAVQLPGKSQSRHDMARGGAFRGASQSRKLQPFPHNKNCFTNLALSDEIRYAIHDDITNNQLSAQQVAQKYGIKIPRVEAVAKLITIEQSWEKNNHITPALRKMSSVMFNMFPLFEPKFEKSRENLSEIPVPSKALNSRFLTIAESEPFGPLDAAKVLELEPAAETLQKLSTEGEHSAGHTETTRKQRVVYGELLKGERSVFKFTHKPVGKVGYRYGAGNRDNKKDRKIGFNELGQMVYL